MDLLPFLCMKTDFVEHSLTKTVQVAFEDNASFNNDLETHT